MSQFTAIAVDPQVSTTNGKTFDVIFIGKSKLLFLILNVLNELCAIEPRKLDTLWACLNDKA